MKLKSIIPLIAVSICLTSCEMVTGKSFDFKKYEEYRNKVGSAYGTAKGLLPPVDELGNYETVQFAYKQVAYFFFQSEGISLFLDYNEENYALAKSYVEENYTFIDDSDTVAKADYKYYQFPVASFEYKEYSFRIAPTPQVSESSEEPYYMCKSFVMIGYNESLLSVAYLYFYDFDIDYLYCSDGSSGKVEDCMPKLIQDSFYWRK